MRLLFIINTPAQAYTWQHTMEEFRTKGHEIKVLARNYGATPGILRRLGFECSTFEPVGAGTGRLFGSFRHFQQCIRLSRGFDPTMVIGFGIDAAITAARFRKPCILFIDDDPTHLQNSLSALLASSVITPHRFPELGKKQVRIQSYKEFAYLHPRFFSPDISIYDELKLEKGARYAILRFNAWDAVHDIGHHGFTIDDQFTLVREIEKYAEVFISPERPLHKDLEKYRLPISQNRIHHALYYAQLLITDTQTMATEAAILGTPVVRSNNFAGPHDLSNFIELEEKYDLIYSFPEARDAVAKALDLIKRPDLKKEWAQKRLKLLADKIDFSQFLVDYIENFPDSYEKYRRMRGS
jgi:predicted glycosyltransferase